MSGLISSHPLGETGITVSDIALGTDYYGKTVSRQQAFCLLDTYMEAGGNIVDTAHVYADYLPGERHSSEKTIGQWLRERGCRKKIIISSKGGFPILEDYHKSRLSYHEVLSDLEGSLECLGVDYIDLYWLHRDDERIEVGCLVEMLNDFKKKGMIRCFGASNFKSSRIAEANLYAEKHGLEGFCASQIKWGLATTAKNAEYDDTLQEMDDLHYRFHKETNFPLFAYASQAKGFFSKVFFNEQGNCDMPPGKCKDRYFCEENVTLYKKLYKLSEETGMPVAEIALRKMISESFPVTCIVGSKTQEHLKLSLSAAMNK